MKKIIQLMFLLIVSSISYAQTTNIPDTIFEHYLETHSKIDGSVVAVGDANSMGNGTDGDHLVTTTNIINITFLNVSDLGISDMTGIEDFTSLTDFYCARNNITSITLPNVTTLNAFIVEDNQLTTINFPASITNLGEFGCQNNNITSIDFNNITYINFFVGDNNQFTVLDFSTTDVEGMNCSNNPNLESIDFRNGADYTEVYAFNATNNPNLTCIFVDDVTYANTNWTNIDATSTFVADETACAALATEEFALNEFKILSNPVFDTIKISIQEVAEYRLIDINGKILQKGKLTIGYNTINVVKLTKGIYFLNISSLNKNITKKIIK